MRSDHPGKVNLKLQILIQPNIGLDGEARLLVIEILKVLLSDEAVLAMKTRSAHWHIRGPGFLELRNLFDQQYHELNAISDETAERVRMLGGFAISSFEEILHFTRLEETPGEAPDVINLLADHEASIRYLREDARKCLEEYEDQGTFTLLVRLIGLHEKMAWFLRSYIQPELSPAESQGFNTPSNSIHFKRGDLSLPDSPPLDIDRSEQMPG